MHAGALEVVAPGPAELDALDAHLQTLTSPADSLESAWRAIAWNIRRQGPYFRRDDTGRALAARTEEAIRLAREGGRPQDLLPEGTQFPRTAFFLGYWAWVMSPEQAPQDGRVAKTWLAAFHPRQAPHMRIGFPAQLLRLPVRASAAAPAPGKGPVLRADVLARISELKGYHTTLKSLLGAKLTGADAKSAPWRVLPADIQSHPELFNTVRSLGLDPYATDIPAQLDALRAAATRLELDDATRRPARIRLIGSTYVRTHDDRGM